MADVACAIIGGGVIGRSAALALGQGAFDGDVVVVESSPRDRVENQSTRNSGVIHAGIYYSQHSRPLKAKLCVEGNALLYEFCQELNVSHAKTGKLVVANGGREESYLRGILAVAIENQVRGVQLVGSDDVRAMEPNVRASAALYVPSSGIVDTAAYLTALRGVSAAHNLFATRVVAVRPKQDCFEVETLCNKKRESFTSKWVINAAGSHGDDVAWMVNPASRCALVPTRGESAKFYRSRRPGLALSGMSIYPVPAGFYPDGRRANVDYAEFQRLLTKGEITETVGVHLTPTLAASGELADTFTIGPAITTDIGKDDYAQGLRPLSHYHDCVSEFFPGLTIEDIELHQAGIQARMAGQLDWHIAADPQHPRFIHVLGIDSPGMTASLAIGRHVAELLQ